MKEHKQKKLILGFAGEMSSGKTTATTYLVEKHGAAYFRFSTILRDMLDRLYLPHSRDNLDPLSTFVRQEYGEDTFARVLARDVGACDSAIIAVDGIRREADVKYLREMAGFTFVYIDADLEKRFDRITKRGENADDNTKTFDDFVRDHELEPQLQIRGLEEKADVIIDNNGNLERLYKEVDDLILK